MQTVSYDKPTLTGVIAAVWGIGGFMLLIVVAILKLSQMAVECFQSTFSVWHWALLIGNIIFMAYSEGYKGFQLSYAPRLAARARYLSRTSSFCELTFAPIFCMSYFNAPRTRITVSVILTVAIILLVILFRMLPQPWRGILDAGVVVGLSWGLVSTIYFCVQAFSDPGFSFDPEIPYPSYRLQEK